MDGSRSGAWRVRYGACNFDCTGISAVFSLLIFFTGWRYKSVFAWFDGQELRSMLDCCSVDSSAVYRIHRYDDSAGGIHPGTQALAGYAATMRVRMFFLILCPSAMRFLRLFPRISANKPSGSKRLPRHWCWMYFAALAFLVIERCTRRFLTVLFEKTEPPWLISLGII